MEDNRDKSHQNTQKSTEQIDFIPPEHSYIVNQQFNSAFFRDHCEEEYQIQRAFGTNNFTYLRNKIPNQLKHGAILEQRLNKVHETIQTETIHRNKPPSTKEEERQNKIHRKKMEQIGQLGYFQVFPYQQSLYTIEHDLKLRQTHQAKRKQEQISMLDFRPVGFDKKMKYQNPFQYIDRLEGTNNFKQQYLFPFHLPEDTYDQFHASELRQRIIKQSSKIAGDFIPASNEKSLTKVTRSKVGQILKEVQEYLKKFLGETSFFIGVNKRDYIDILFQHNQVDNPRVHLIMSRLCQSQTVSRFLLRRNIWKWGRIGEESGYLQFCVLPPWVKDPQQKLIKD